MFSGTWPQWGTMRNGECWERCTLAPRIAEKGYGSWPTIAARDHRGGNSKSFKDRGGGAKGEQLPNFIQHKWSVPAWESCRHCGEFWCNVHQVHAFDCECPPVEDWDTDPYSHPPHMTPFGVQFSLKGRWTGPQLNPRFGEWLMGWPVGWTESKPLETAKFQQWLHSHGVCCAPGLGADQ